MMPNSNLRRIWRHPLFLPFYLPSLFLAFAQGLLIPILPLYAASFDVSYGLIGLLLAGDGIGALLSDVPVGMLLRRLNAKIVMLIGMGCLIFSTVALFWAQSVPEALIYRMLTGMGMAFFGVSRHTYLTGRVTLVKRGRAIALFGGVNRIGQFAGPAIGGALAAAFGLRVPFLVFGAVGVGALLLVATFLHRNDTALHKEVDQSENHINHLFSTVRTSSNTLLTGGAGQLFAQVIRAGWRTVIPLYGDKVLGLGPDTIGFIISFLRAIDMSLFYPTGMIMDRWGRKFAIVPSFLIQSIGLALVPFTANFLGLLWAASVIGYGNGLGSGTMMTLGSDLAPESSSRGEFLGVWRLIGDTGATGGPLAVGAIADLVTLPVAGLVVAGAGVVAATIFAHYVPETLQRKPRPVT